MAEKVDDSAKKSKEINYGPGVRPITTTDFDNKHQQERRFSHKPKRLPISPVESLPKKV